MFKAMSRTTSKEKAKDWQSKARTKNLKPKTKDAWSTGLEGPRGKGHVLEDSISDVHKRHTAYSTLLTVLYLHHHFHD